MSSSSPPPATAPAPTSPPSATTPTSPPPPKSPLPTPPVPSPTSPPTPTSPAPTSPPPTSPPPSTPPPSKPVTPPPKPVAPPTPPPPPASSPPPSPAASSPPPSSSGSSPPPPATPSTSSPPPPSSPSRRSPPSSPSPPPPSRKSPPSSSASPPPPPSSSNSISTPLVVGIAVGAVVVLVLLSVLCICCRRKKRRTQGPLDYYGGPPPPQKDDASGGWQHIAPPPADHVVQIPPQPPPPPPFASRPPPRPMISSSGGSGSNYSGSENPLPPPSPGIALSFSKSTFTFEELAKATDGFSDANLLGQGGFGYVHRGVLLNGKEVAIKQLKSGSGQGEREFQAEVEIISRVHHRHLVSLVGYCISGGQRLLVYDLAPNYTLEFHLHGKDRPTMDWPTRLKIALGSAKGLAYLHEDCRPKIIHRDIKASNILLDYEFEAKVADFGLAKFAYDNNTHISTRVMGTFGYMAPEYASTGKLTDKSDVFSFGVMLLELITGRRPVDSTQAFNESLVDWARPLLTRALEDDNYDALVDPRLEYYNPNERARMVACAAACVRHSARHRPRMSQIVRALEGDVSLDDLNEGVRPGHSTHYGSYGSSEYDSGQYNQDMKKFRKMALQSQDFASSESSAPTSDYGQNPSASSSEGQQTREMEMGKMKTDSQGFSSSPRNLTSD